MVILDNIINQFYNKLCILIKGRKHFPLFLEITKKYYVGWKYTDIHNVLYLCGRISILYDTVH